MFIQRRSDNVRAFFMLNKPLLINFFPKIVAETKKTCIFAKQNNNDMNTNQINPELIEVMYKATQNKIRFMQVFATTRFHLCSEDMLERMFKYLQTKNK